MPSLLRDVLVNQLRMQSDMLRWSDLVGVEPVHDHRQRVEAVEIELRACGQVVCERELDTLTGTRAQDERLDRDAWFELHRSAGSRSSVRKYMIAVGS